jgi:hypothetical protein
MAALQLEVYFALHDHVVPQAFTAKTSFAIEFDLLPQSYHKPAES